MLTATGSSKIVIAYFSMEIALDSAMPTYSGGLGVLAGDTLRAAADLAVPMAAVTLVHRKGYFRQKLNLLGQQSEQPEQWQPEAMLEAMGPIASLRIEGREVRIRAWRYAVQGLHGHAIPVYLLDTAVEGNTADDQALTDSLYGGDSRYRLCQEAVLGLGGVEMLRLMGHTGIRSYHMNEGHSALLTLALAERQISSQSGAKRAAKLSDADHEAVRRQCVFTTHTPVPAGHDKFSWPMVKQVLGADRADLLSKSGCCADNALNLTFLALRFSRYINGVAMSHGEVSQGMYPSYPIRSITNGVHAHTWTSRPFQTLYDQHIPQWRTDNRYLRNAIGIPLKEIQQAHQRAKQSMLELIAKRTGVKLKEGVFTIGFARRATAYKRAALLFTNIQRLRWIARMVGPLQIIFGGKAHPNDAPGKALIRDLFEVAESLKGAIQLVYVENYDMEWGKSLTSGADLWLNTPQRPLEASGTSGMKAVLNGVPSLSVLDGWWVEGHVEGKTGWCIGNSGNGPGSEVSAEPEDAVQEANSLYDKLETTILPMYYGQPNAYAAVMRYTISLNGSYFNTQRMVRQYLTNAYFPEGESVSF
ncbi:MAG: alpha-glucan family phosphorylase [Acidobacteria bacterium]|nr:alpha-glucan family phosphorylase [Acidobacteriota bacterium]